MSKTDKKLSAISLVLVAVMVFTAIFNVIYVGNIAAAKISNNNQQLPTDNAGFVKSDMNFDSIREQYLNHELVQKNTASYDGDRWVIVELTGGTLYDAFKTSTRYNDFSSYTASVEGQKVQASIKADHTTFLNRLSRHGIDYQLKYTYSAITNALAIKVNAEAYNAIRKMSGVADVYYTEYYDVPKVAVENNANVYTTGIYNTEGIDYHGEGMVVAVLDTGLDATHEAFQNMPKDGGRLKKTDIENAVNAVDNNGRRKLLAEGTADDFYYNEKVPFAYDYADDDPNVYPAYSSHGTHVAGIVAGKSDYVVNEETGETFVGVAPEAQLVICKVFTDNLDSEVLGGANTMGILAALNDCAVLGVDVINMSLGSSAGFSEERGDSAQTQFLNRVYGAIEDMGISLVVAASNDYSSGFGGGNGTNLASNPDSGTVGSPSTYSSALSVASINGRKSSYILGNNTENQVAFITNSSNEFGQEFNFIDQLYAIASEMRGTPVAKGQPLKFKYVSIEGFGRPNEYTANIRRQLDKELAKKEGYDGVIALVKRGETTFAEKVQVAMGAGAQACIIYNNVAGTIRMSLGDVEDPIPTCSISMDAGKVLAQHVINSGKSFGVINVNSDYLAGPFMSEFSSWGPTPDLQLKPEITAHGGEIISAVAGGYDKLSGTSMAAPNMAGAISLLRQDLKAEYPGLSGKELNALVNQRLMSTATIAKNEDNNPYSPRKQGAGLAGIADAINAEGYITVLDENQNERDKTKIELYDTAKKTGVYTLDFIMHNITDTVQSYKPVTYVMTETMSSDGKTVAEKAYMLNDMCSIEYSVGTDSLNLKAVSGNIQVQPNSTLAVRVVITLDASAKKYLDTNFVNGMYIEGFVSMEGIDNTKVTLGVPYLGFYGDWTAAPMFDYDVYEIAEDDKDTSLTEYEKIKASSAATMAVGMYYEDEYVVPLGSYIYAQDEDEVEVYPEREKIAISMFDDDRGHSIYELYMVYAGLLRGAAEMDVVITNDATGEIIYEDKLLNVRKAYAGGGANRGSAIMLEINPGEWGLANNSTYSVSLRGKLDYEGGENPERNTWEFPFTVDYEQPEMIGYKIRYMPYTENKVVKYRIFMDVEVRDNQFVSSVVPCYIKSRPTGLGDNEDVLTLLTEYPIPVSGQRGEASTVSFEITDYYEEYIKTGKMYLQVEDYALNSVVYQIIPGRNNGEDAMSDPVSVDFVTDANLKKVGEKVDSLGTVYGEYNLVLAPYTLYTFNAVTNPTNTVLKSLTWNYDGTRVKAQGNELFTGAGGRAVLKLTNTTSLASARKTYAVVNVLISGSGSGKMPVLESISLNAVLNGDGNITSLNPPGSATPELELNPNQQLKLTWNWNPWYCDKPNVTWSSSNPDIVSVSDDGTIKAIKRGQAYIEVKAVDKPSVVKSVKVVVGRDYYVNNLTLYHYYGEGEIEIPSNLNIMYLDEQCFKGNDKITKVILPATLTEIPENAFLGCVNLKEVVIPGQCTTIKENAFAGCVALETVTLGMFVDSDKNELGDDYAGTITLGRNAFKDCVKLKNITNQKRITTVYERAFEGCISLERIDISALRVVANGAFKDCTSLKYVTMSKDTALGRGMFEGCTSLLSLTGDYSYKGSVLPEDIFSGCAALGAIEFANELTYIGANAFKNTAISNITLPNGNMSIAAGAFNNSTLGTLTLSANTVISFEGKTPFVDCDSFNRFVISGTSANYSVDDNGILYNKDKTQLVAVPYSITLLTMPSTVTSIATGALSGVNIASLDLSNVRNIGGYAFAGNTAITSVKLPSGLTEIPAGLFEGCTNLTSVTADDSFASVTKIGENAFKNCSALTGVAMANVKEIGDGAFEFSAITAVPGAKIEKIGANAFANTKLITAILNTVTELGSNAFMNISTLTTVELGGVTSMGEGVFQGSTGITSVVFGAGTKRIGARAFYSENKVDTAITVTLPKTVDFIEQYAFYNLAGLTTIYLGGVKYVDQYAFAYTGLAIADLAGVKQIGYGAFAYTKLTSVNLASANIVGESAFFNCSELTSVTFGALKRIGAYAFFNSKLTSVTLPASFDARTYTYEWNTYDEKGDLEDEKAREELAYSPAAFSGISTLAEIKVAEGNKTFFDVDGVLYSRVPNGYAIEQYPVNKAGKEYTIIDNTVLISESAFEYTVNLNKVTIPYTVKTVGAYAFFKSNCSEYIFNSVDAPKLLATVITENDVDDAQLKRAFSRLNGGYAVTNFYTNFKDYAVNADPTVWSPVDDFELTVTIPLNARGYVGVWKLFFTTIKYTEKNMPDDTTHKAFDAIDKLPSVQDVKTMSYEQINTTGSIGKLAAEARLAYNMISLPEQIELASEYYGRLLAIEEALRARKAELGHPVRIAELKLANRPDKIRYEVGEKFDATGMVLTAIYEDGSEVALTGTNYTITPEVIAKDTKAVIITYKDAATGQIVSTEIRINVVSSPVDPVEPGPIDGDGSAKELTAGQKAGIAIGVILGVALIAGAVVAVILIKKKKDGATKQASASDNADNDSNKEAGENSVDKTECEASAEGAEIAEEKTEQALTEENAAENVTADTQSLTDNNDSKAETTEEDSIITENDATATEATDSESPQTASEESVNTVEAKVAEDENND